MQKNQKMPRRVILATLAVFLMSGSGSALLTAQDAEPHGGFSKSVSGKWNCGDFGTMVLKDSSGNVTGTYTYNNGVVQGKVQGNVFSGTWQEKATGDSGAFQFAVSIERMTTKPTNLRGKWNYTGESTWQSTPWECQK